MRLLVLLSLLFLAACGRQEPNSTQPGVGPAPATLPRIATVNYPLAWAVEQLCLDTAAVYFPAPADVDPAFWQPGSDELIAYQQSALIFLNGANYARWAYVVGGAMAGGLSSCEFPRSSLLGNKRTKLLRCSRNKAHAAFAFESGPKFL